MRFNYNGNICAVLNESNATQLKLINIEERGNIKDTQSKARRAI